MDALRASLKVTARAGEATPIKPKMPKKPVKTKRLPSERQANPYRKDVHDSQ